MLALLNSPETINAASGYVFFILFIMPHCSSRAKYFYALGASIS